MITPVSLVRSIGDKTRWNAVVRYRDSS